MVKNLVSFLRPSCFCRIIAKAADHKSVFPNDWGRGFFNLKKLKSYVTLVFLYMCLGQGVPGTGVCSSLEAANAKGLLSTAVRSKKLILSSCFLHGAYPK